jgi:hypothetical protein
LLVAAVAKAVIIVVLFGGYLALMGLLFGFLIWQVRHRDPRDDDTVL